VSDNSVSSDDINNISTAAIAYRKRRPHYGGRRFPIEPWHQDNGDPVIVSVVDFARYAEALDAVTDLLYVCDDGLLRLDEKRLIVRVVTQFVEAGHE
jgi:hypothetical protein